MSTVVHISEAASLASTVWVFLPSIRPSTLQQRRLLARLVHHTPSIESASEASQVRLGEINSGPRGGFTLAKPADQITLLDVCEAIEGPIEMPSCYLGKKDCLLGSCLFNGFVSSTTAQFRDYLAGKRLTDLKHTGE